MSDRFPPIPPAERSQAQRVADDMIQEMVANSPPNTFKNSNGCFVGPYAVLMYNPNLIAPWISLAGSVTTQEIITPREKELAVLAVSAVYDAPYILYAHAHIATDLGLSQEQISRASKGEVPCDLTKAEVVVYQTALELAGGRKALGDASWQRAYEVLGREKTAGIAHVVGGYVYVAVLLNVGAVGTPE